MFNFDFNADGQRLTRTQKVARQRKQRKWARAQVVRRHWTVSEYLDESERINEEISSMLAERDAA